MKEELQKILRESNVAATIECKLGKGAFGDVWGVITDQQQKFAVKFEKLNNKYSTLQKEAKIMLMLKEGEGFPRPRQFRNSKNMDLLMMDRLGPNLEKLLKACGGRFSLKTGLMILDQMLQRMEYFHAQNLIHRDIKPENFVVGSVDSLKTVFLIDYGIAKLYRSQKGDHISFKEGKGLIGTARYTSVNSHLGVEQSRRDDLEGLAYTIIYLLRGRLPWQSTKGIDKKDKYQKILNIKAGIHTKKLCEGLPSEFTLFFNYIKGLNFSETPNYHKLRSLFEGLFKRKGYLMDFEYDWVVRDENQRRVSSQLFKLRSGSIYSISVKQNGKDENMGEREGSQNSSRPFSKAVNAVTTGIRSRRQQNQHSQINQKTKNLQQSQNNSLSMQTDCSPFIQSRSSSCRNKQMVKVPVTRMKTLYGQSVHPSRNINGGWREWCTARTGNSTMNSRYRNRSALKYETEQTGLRCSDKERNKLVDGAGAGGGTPSVKKEGLLLSRIRDYPQAEISKDLENLSDWEDESTGDVNQLISGLVPLKKKFIYHTQKICLISKMKKMNPHLKSNKVWEQLSPIIGITTNNTIIAITGQYLNR